MNSYCSHILPNAHHLSSPAEDKKTSNGTDMAPDQRPAQALHGHCPQPTAYSLQPGKHPAHHGLGNLVPIAVPGK